MLSFRRMPSLRRRLPSRAFSALPSSADVVVVGGGSLGASVLYHLRKRGLDAILLEKNQLTAGTT
jgi:glycerol-3-phosphate dehydrogenase